MTEIEDRYFKLIKDYKQLNLKYESQVHQNHKLEEQLAKIKPHLIPKETPPCTKCTENRQHQLQLSKKQKEIAKLNIELRKRQQQILHLKTLLYKEVGDPDFANALVRDCNLEKAAPPSLSAGWRGRAEEIAALRGKLKALAALPALRGGPPGVLNRTCNRCSCAASHVGAIRAEPAKAVDRCSCAASHVGAIRAELADARTELAAQRQRAQVFAARVGALERQAECHRGVVEALAAKSNGDDRLIAAYQDRMARPHSRPHSPADLDRMHQLASTAAALLRELKESATPDANVMCMQILELQHLLLTSLLQNKVSAALNTKDPKDIMKENIYLRNELKLLAELLNKLSIFNPM